MQEFKTIRYEHVEDHIVRVAMNRPEKRNAQNHTMTYELNDAFTEAARDNDVKVIILSGEGPHFNSGHDQTERGTKEDIRTVGTWFGYDLPGVEGSIASSREVYFDTIWRWRNIPKPMIAQVHGKCIGGGLMLAWASDIIIASEEATFADPVVAVGCNGVEYFGHPWELGPRKAKELLFTGNFFSAQDAYDAGMINRVVPLDKLDETVMTMARRIATKPTLGLKLAKEAVNAAQDAQGMYPALRAALSLCSLGHAHIKMTMGNLAQDHEARTRLFANAMVQDPPKS